MNKRDGLGGRKRGLCGCSGASGLKCSWHWGARYGRSAALRGRQGVGSNGTEDGCGKLEKRRKKGATGETVGVGAGCHDVTGARTRTTSNCAPRRLGSRHPRTRSTTSRPRTRCWPARQLCGHPTCKLHPTVPLPWIDWLPKAISGENAEAPRKTAARRAGEGRVAAASLAAPSFLHPSRRGSPTRSELVTGLHLFGGGQAASWWMPPGERQTETPRFSRTRLRSNQMLTSRWGGWPCMVHPLCSTVTLVFGNR